MQKKFFGTDGIRGRANTPPMTAEIAMKLGLAAGSFFRNGGHRHRVIIGKDTRLSGYLIEPALVSGFIAAGMDVVLVGPLPTPAVAMLTRSMRADLGIMISASHNPYYDNGIKIFGPDGYKLSDKIELIIEDKITNNDFTYADSHNLGRAKRLDDAAGRYIEFVKNTFPKKLILDGLKIVVDSANGAAYNISELIFTELGAEVISIAAEPNGFNINDKCGSTYPKYAQKAVIEHQADLGIILDGDADRLIMVDENGKLVDGDELIAIIATYLSEQNSLKNMTVVATIMSNLGLEQYLNSLNINLIRTKVGDRYVVEEMRNGDISLGGEQSGHLILAEHATTGDGLVAALQILAALIIKNKKMSELANTFTPLPQIMRNIQSRLSLSAGEIEELTIKTNKVLGNKGRLLIRKSGTESLIRVMIEGEDLALITNLLNEICIEIEATLQCK